MSWLERSTASAAAFLVGISLSNAAVAEVSTGEGLAEIRGYLSQLETLGFAGAVAISKLGQPLLAEGYGLADRERAIAWTPATVSTVGSLTKQFTGATVLLLQEQDLLSIEDPITKFFDEVPDEKRSITIHHLLTHSSGVVDLEDAEDFDPLGRTEFVQRALAQPLEFAPGTSYQYSNAGYSLLGAIIELRTGKTYEEFLRQSALNPSGIYETGYILPYWGDGRLAQGYADG